MVAFRATVLSNRAAAKLSMGGDLGDCVADCTAALALEPANLKALLRRAMAREQMDKFKDAAHDFYAVLQLDRASTLAQHGLARVVAVR